MKLYVRIKINDKWTYRAINTKNTDMLSLIGKEGWTWNDNYE